MTMPAHPDIVPDDGLLEEAADWLVRLMSGEATEADARALRDWRDLSPAHDAAFREIAGVGAYAHTARTTSRPTSRRAFVVTGVAGGAVVLAGAALMRPPLGLWPSYAEFSADHRAPVGGQASFQPMDGVDVHLASRSSASLLNAGRGVRLISGEALINARTNAGGFRLDARRVRIEAANADFNVQAFGARDRVTCIRGTLTCTVGGKVIPLAENQDLAIDGRTAPRLTRTDGAKVAAWRTGRLIFEGAPLTEVIDQINLYRPGRIVLRNPDLGRAPLNAVFHIAQIDGAVAQIEQLLNVKARAIGGGVVLLG